MPDSAARDFFQQAEPGDYCGPVTGFTGDKPAILLCLPNGSHGHVCSPPHDPFVEHEDGTVTVSPSILNHSHDKGEWHGYLERGVWREC